MVELVRAGREPGELARPFEPSAQAIRNWVAQADRDDGHRQDGLTTDEREELRRLRRENKALPEERELSERFPGVAGCGQRRREDRGQDERH
jgi:transposase